MKKIFLLAFSALLFFYSFALISNPTSAKKKIVRRGTSSTVTGSSRLIVKPKLRNDRRALIINFSNLNTVSSFSYELMYTTNNIPQGVAGTVTPVGETQMQRELLFGTCSKNVCRYHSGISGMKLTVTSTLKSGVKIRQTFRIRP